MFHPTQIQVEVAYHQKKTRAEYIQAQRQISIGGLRQIIGNTIIEMGGRIYGVTQSSCQEAAEAHGRVRSVLRAPDKTVQPTASH